jgi:Fe-S cluster assembly protein SufD
VRHDQRVLLNGSGARAELRGLTLARGEQHLDLHTFVDHAVPGASSAQVFKAAVKDRSTSLFNGDILVRENAVKTDARQVNRNLVLSDEACVFSQPRLTIHADDVKCTHGSATGPLDEDSVFYLRSRGVPESQARRMLLSGFVDEILGSLPEARDEAKARAVRWLDGKEDGS